MKSFHGRGFGGGSVYDGVYMIANITNDENQTMLVYVPQPDKHRASFIHLGEEGWLRESRN